MNILHLSDTHGAHRSLGSLPEADVIVHSGDITMNGSSSEALDFMRWFSALPYAHKIFVAGNHDACLYGAVIDGLDSNCHYLCNSLVEIDGVTFYGVPMFMEDCSSGRQKEFYEMIPDGVDVLITHAPPYGILDQDGSIHYGSYELLSRVTAVRPRIHLFGHIHKANGLEERGGTVFSNAAMMDEHYGMLLEPHLINLQIMEEKLEKYQKTIDLCSSIMKKIKAERMSNTKMGKYVNVFSLWNEFSGISEPIHSRILHFFLSDNPMHGQGKLFLSAFLEYIGFEQDKGNEEWIITAEEGRVDVLLRRLNPLGAVIIENKSNWAGDQPNQLYRYWYENIHKDNEDCKESYYKEHPEYKIVYLVPDEIKHISVNSITCPDDYPEDLPETLPMELKVMTFHEDIPKWLGECMKGLPAENTPLRNLIAQYIEYCKQL